MRIALYARVSTKDKGQDHENQLRELREFVTRKAGDGWVLSHEYVDKASGKTAERPQFQRLFEDASRRQFDLVLFWSLDRFSREGVLETLQHLQRLSSHGVEWFSYREEYLRSIGVFKEAVLAILAAIAKQERIRLSERVQAGLSRARSQGKVLGRPKAAVRPARVLRLRERGLSMRRIAAETGVDPSAVPGSGKDGRVTKGDMLAAIERAAAQPTPVTSAQLRAPSAPDDAAREERVRMTRLRQTIARRLKDAQNTAAMLTTFNEVDMTHVMALRSQYRELFEKKHGIKLGFMGFFVRACVQALKEIPAVNAEIDGTDIVYKNYYHIGIAVGTERGLVVPVVRDCDQKSIAEIEKAIADFGRRARDGALKIEELQGGTFSITNGGIYGSLMSTPILNAPQSGILGMHKIQERPMVVAGKIEARPMMYLALSYDHRVVDGREAVTFLVRVKESLEEPARLVLDL